VQSIGDLIQDVSIGRQRWSIVSFLNDLKKCSEAQFQYDVPITRYKEIVKEKNDKKLIVLT
jgi:hypothetical protein